METKDQPAKKPGLQTTEFYIALIAVLAGPLMTYFDKIDGPWGVVASAFIGGVYAALRTSTKTELLKTK